MKARVRYTPRLKLHVKRAELEQFMHTAKSYSCTRPSASASVAGQLVKLMQENIPK